MEFKGNKKESPELISCGNLSVGYGQQVVASGITFQLHAGDYLCIVGENGSGKSTLMKTLLGMQPPVSGELRRAEGLLRQGIGYLPQQSVTQRDFPASVQEIVISGLQRKVGWRPYYTRAERDLAMSTLERLGIRELAKKSYRNLSGGQQQRVLLARAILATKELLLLDEPVAGLDPGAMREMYRIIEELNEEGTTIIMISHDVEQALEYASHILQMGEVPYFMPKGEMARNRHWRSIAPGKARIGQPEFPVRPVPEPGLAEQATPAGASPAAEGGPAEGGAEV
ncbi:MAG: ABC transporter ATP-binding protein [Mogibacterium sp.]|nr:ABC transporter ATP-binding protein [Mogibacterium sp.]